MAQAKKKPGARSRPANRKGKPAAAARKPAPAKAKKKAPAKPKPKKKAPARARAGAGKKAAAVPVEMLARVRGRGRPAEFREDMRPFLALRAEGATYAAIARAIEAATGETVSPTSVRRWVKAIDSGKNPAGTRDLPTATDRLSIHLTPIQRESLEDAVHLIRRGTGRMVKATAGTLARDLIHAAFARGLLEELAQVDGMDSYQRAIMGACQDCGDRTHSTRNHPRTRTRRRRGSA